MLADMMSMMAPAAAAPKKRKAAKRKGAKKARKAKKAAPRRKAAHSPSDLSRGGPACAFGNGHDSHL